jgi:hypothetical protein
MAGAQQVSQQISMGQNQTVIASILQPVTGAPYQAEEVTRSVQKLYDGTVITHETRSTVARDADGRMRQDMYIVHSGQVDGRQVDQNFQSATVGDPVTHTMLFWTGTDFKTAMRMQLPSLPAAATRTGLMGGIAGTGSPLANSKPPQMLKEYTAPVGTVKLGTNGSLTPTKNQVSINDLGQQSIEGVLVTGQRTTTTIPTGAIGNDRPIVAIHEEWRSPELKILVKSSDSDPRTGEQMMELHNIVRSAPDASMFQAPAGYKVQDFGDVLKTLGQIGRTPSPKQ